MFSTPWMRRPAALAPYAIATAALVLAMLLLDADTRLLAANWLSLIGMVLLAAPTIRLNEQGQRIWRLRRQIALNEAAQARLSTAAGSEAERELKTSAEETLEDLRDAERALLDEKGAWTPLIHKVLYGGYCLFFASAVTRLL